MTNIENYSMWYFYLDKFNYIIIIFGVNNKLCYLVIAMLP